MKKLVLFLFSITLLWGGARAQKKRLPAKELQAQGEHVKSSGNDLLHLRFKKAHKKHLAEARRRNRGIDKDLKGVPLPKPSAPKLPPHRPPTRQ